MPLNLYCPFCGVILLRDPHELEILPPETRVRPWYAQVRGLYFRDVADQQISITGVGLVDTENCLIASTNPDVSYLEDEWGTVGEWEIYEATFEDCLWCFGFHDSCWGLLLLRLGYGQRDGSLDKHAIAESVFYQLYCTSLHESSSFRFGHDYLGAGETHKPFGEPKPIDPDCIFYADPWAIPSLHDLETIAANSPQTQDDPLQNSTTAASNADHHQGAAHDSGPLKPNDNRCSSPSSDDTKEKGREPSGGRKPHALNRFPSELLCKIFSYLSFNDLLKTRLVCHDLAHFSELEAIPKEYWWSRFYLGQEADFIFPDLTDRRDWSLLFFGITKYLRSKDLPLLNRKRIRQLIEPIAVLVEAGSVFKNGPCGLAVHRAPGQARCCQLVMDDMAEEESPQLVNTTKYFSGKFLPIDRDRPLIGGCRVLCYRMQLSKPSPVQHQRRFCISMVQIGARRFISGINLPVWKECDASDGRLLGYHNPTLKMWVDIPSTARLRGLEVAFCSEGLTGIKFIFTNFSSPGWFGVNKGEGIATGILEIPKGKGRCCLLAGLDHFKIVSLAFGELVDHCEGRLKLPCTCNQDFSRPHSQLWLSCPPRHGKLALSTLLPPQSSLNFEPLDNLLLPRWSLAFNPLVNFDFGGPKGVSLGCLMRLAVCMMACPFPLVGIEAFYSCGRSRLFGLRGGCVLSIFVNGPGGERINDIRIFEDSPDDDDPPSNTLDGLQVSTNFGRTATFAPLHIRSNVLAGEILAPPHGHTMTGFTAVWQDYHGGVVRMGIQSQPCGEQPPVPSISNHECHLEHQDQLQYDVKFSQFIISSHGGNCQTYASLKNVRRIQASTGMEDLSRSITRITGLKLEYHGHPSPGVVGQWMNPLDDSFELSPDEDIRSLTTWLTPIHPREELTVLEIGQVVAIHIETTLARSATFRPPGFDSLPSRKLQHQHRANTGETLTAISWIMNSYSDCVRAVITANTPARRAQISVPEPIAPFDQVCKLDFERIPTPDDTASQRDIITTAEAYFDSRTIIGLVFVYTSGSRASIGNLDTATHKAVHFCPHARIVGLSAMVSNHDLAELAFEVEFDHPPQPHCHILMLSNSPLPRVDPERYNRWDVWCKEDDSHVQRNRQPIFYSERFFVHPAQTRLVGMYFRCQRLGDVGAVYEPEVSLEGS